MTHSAPAPDDAAEQLLLERARLLAGASSAPAPQAELAAVVCRVRQELYAIELGSSVAVLAANGITGVPCTPPHIAGVLNVRGDIVTMLDLAAALGLGASPPTHSDSARVVLIEHQRGRLGLLVDEVQEIRPVSLDRLERSLSDRPFVRGIADGQVVLLDLALLLAERRLEVNEQPI